MSLRLIFVKFTWAGHAPLQLLQGFCRQGADLVLEPPLAVQSQVPKTRLPLAVSAQLVAGFAEAVVEAQVVPDGVLPAIWSCLKEGEVLSGRGWGGNMRDMDELKPKNRLWCNMLLQRSFTI